MECEYHALIAEISIILLYGSNTVLKLYNIMHTVSHLHKQIIIAGIDDNSIQQRTITKAST